MNKALEIVIVLAAVDKMNEVISKAVGKANKTLNTMNDVGGKMALGGAGMTAFFGGSVNEAEKSEVATRRLAQVYKSMGEIKGVAAKQDEAYASALQMQIGIEDESIMAVQAKIATFKSLSDETGRLSGMFNRATEAAYDMAATGFGEASQNAVQLGKALEDPIKGINSLRKSGITFSDSERNKIKVLVESNKKLEAQKMIMKAVEKQVGGVAKATVSESTKMKISLGEIMETIGKGLLPAFNSLARTVQKYLPLVQKWVEDHKGLIKILAVVGVGLLVVGTSLKVLAMAGSTAVKSIELLKVVFQAGKLAGILFSQGINAATLSFKAMDTAMKANVILLVLGLIVTAAIAIYENWDKIAAFFKRQWDMVKAVFSAAWEWIKNKVENMPGVGIIIRNWSKIKAFFVGLWDGVKNTFSGVWNWIKDLFLRIPIVGSIIKNWDKIKSYFGELWGGVKEKFMSFMNWITGIPKRMWEAGKNMIQSLWDGIKSMIMKPIDAIKGMVGKIREYLPFSPAKVGPLKDLHRVKIIETIADNMKPHSMVKAMRKTAAVTMAAAGSVGGASGSNSISSNVGGNSIHYNPVIHMSGGGSKEDFAAMLKKHERELLKVIEEANRKTKRTHY